METKKLSDTAATNVEDGSKDCVLDLFGPGAGRQEFKVTFEDGRFVSSAQLIVAEPQAFAATTAGNNAGLTRGWLTMSQAALKCRCSLHWFSRNWRGWGLHPSRLSRLLFDENEIEALLKQRRITRRGRPHKVRDLHA